MEERQRRIAEEVAAQFAQEAAGAKAALQQVVVTAATSAAAREPTAQELYPGANPVTGEGFPHLPRRRWEQRPPSWPGTSKNTAGSPTGACCALPPAHPFQSRRHPRIGNALAPHECDDCHAESRADAPLVADFFTVAFFYEVAVLPHGIVAGDVWNYSLRFVFHCRRW